MHTLPKIPPRSAFTLSLTVTTTATGVPVTGATVTVTLTDALGTKQLTEQVLPHLGAGVYGYNAAASTTVQPGRYVADFKVVNSGVESTDRLEFLVSY